ncbi:MAG: GNAT family N-acetyltransferase [Myxococcales bacterium]|nr:GNAT family N-acetyltransferase [Myxococcales bacterium]
MPVVRRVEGPEVPEVTALLAQTFASPTARIHDWLEGAGLEHVWVVATDQVAGCLLEIPMGMAVGGRYVPLLGVAGVAVRPEVRGRGVAKAMMAGWLAEAARTGTLSGLYASTRTLYRSVGYGLAGTAHRARMDTGALRGTPVPGWRPVRAADWSRIQDRYRELAVHRAGRLDRGPYIWGRVRGPEDAPHDAWCLEQDGRLAAWIVLKTTRTDGLWMHLEVKDFGADGPEAHRAVLAFLGSFASMTRTLELPCGPSEPLLDLLPELVYTQTLLEPWMLRILDVPRALEGRGWPAWLSTTLDLWIRDPVLPSNAGRYQVALEGGRASVAVGGEGTFELTPSGLAGLYTGYTSARDLSDRGELVGPVGELDRLTAAFAGPAPGMADFF